MLRWTYSDTYHQHYLTLHGTQVAMVDECVGGQYRVIVNRQRILGRVAGGRAPSLAHAQKMVERWATANLPRLEREVAEYQANLPRHRGADWGRESPTPNGGVG